MRDYKNIWAEINTYRSADQEILLNIRNGGFQKEDGGYSNEFYELLADYEKTAELCGK
ncbi:hypothetical protein acsn021_20320 [Anaerocolumna cellulosilytica]|uniref:Uncharacterized protein n=1 Tax=Anaerocolumna cellulosilytica TaxID=433286 RepID=A0A6S6QSZ1_9FIRM|nr:hypothetical protein [Anaerocolumna cellulosilytica]MBB5196415.1 molybdenum-dependent DNA-binding transcriptional regulator ModE [Anaerocolumna cellulosilytica]BCJ94463.1 hypothetical protein acsn021_20320 [Anaerocolumna cellulosilytica]